MIVNLPIRFNINSNILLIEGIIIFFKRMCISKDIDKLTQYKSCKNHVNLITFIEFFRGLSCFIINFCLLLIFFWLMFCLTPQKDAGPIVLLRLALFILPRKQSFNFYLVTIVVSISSNLNSKLVLFGGLGGFMYVCMCSYGEYSAF